MTEQKKKEEVVYLTLQDIAKADDILEADLFIKAWDGNVRMRGMNAQQRVEFLEKYSNQDGEVKLEAMSYAAVFIGVIKPKITEADIDILREKSPGAIDLILAKFMELSGLEEKSLVEARKNS